MQNKNTKIIFVILFTLIFSVLAYLYGSGRSGAHLIPARQDPVVPASDILGNKQDLISFSILSHSKMHGIVSYRGIITGGYFFEANILINILDTNKNILKASNAMATSDWMTAEPVNFEGNIDFTGLPAGSAYFEIHNDNASGLPEHDKSILIPIVIE